MSMGEFLGAVSQVLRASLLVLVAVLLQVTIATDLDVLGGRPDLVVIVVVAIALQRGPLAGAVAGFVGGFLVDALGLGVIGATSLTLTTVGYIAGVWGERLREAAAVRPLLAIGGASLAAGVAELVVAVLVGSGPAVSPSLFLAVVPGSMLNVLLSIGLYPVIRLALRRRQPRTILIDPESAAAA
jgi:rod shape-determining protein MreD